MKIKEVWLGNLVHMCNAYLEVWNGPECMMRRYISNRITTTLFM